MSGRDSISGLRYDMRSRAQVNQQLDTTYRCKGAFQELTYVTWSMNTISRFNQLCKHIINAK